ncbi:MAG: N-acetyltransferase [Wenzhouxiangella sp.]|jgi:GNAT superfamily N-acetyltransferase|nr:N-acetyltransferase [Wenzhouxiangella sp.]
MSSLAITTVARRRDWKALWQLSRTIYGDDPAWVEPLHVERRALWSKANPWFEHASGELFLARRAGQPVGSVSAQIDRLQPAEQGRRIGYFGQFECVNEPDVAAALMDQAAAWLRARGCTWMRGPYDLGINQSCGLLVSGFETPPMILMGHAQPYYQALMERAGLDGEMDMLAYLVAPNFPAPAAMTRLLERSRGRLILRPLDMRHYEQEVELLRNLFNDAWADNWGFVKLTREEFAHTGREIRRIMNPDHACVAEIDGQAAGFLIALPNLNELIRDLGGRLLPTGWIRLLWRLKRGSATSARVPLMGVRREYQRGPLGAAISFGLIDHVRQALHRDGLREVEMSWILETNRGMNSLIRAMGGDLYKRYRMYGRALD